MKTILVLEDELPVLTLLHQVLKHYGYGVCESVNAEDAIRCFLESDRRIDLLLADVTLPKSSGIEVALQLRARAPDLRVILTSGYPTALWKSQDIADLARLGTDSVAILQKPFEPQTLLNRIHDFIGAQTTVAGKELPYGSG